MVLTSITAVGALSTQNLCQVVRMPRDANTTLCENLKSSALVDYPGLQLDTGEHLLNSETENTPPAGKKLVARELEVVETVIVDPPNFKGDRVIDRRA